jgi:hypothetical protein
MALAILTAIYKPKAYFRFFWSMLVIGLVHLSANAAGIDAGLFNPQANQFEVRLRPSADLESNITNIQFTLKWPENTAILANVSSNYQLTQQGPVFNHNGYNYAVFVSVALGNGIPINWTAGTENTVLTFEADQALQDGVCFEIAGDDWVMANNGVYYVELLGIDHTRYIYKPFAGDCNLIDIGLFNTACGAFEVRLKPGLPFVSSITNLQFALKWPAGTVDLVNFNSNFELEQQGPVFVNGGFNYAVFVAVPLNNTINWIAGEEYVVLTFEHDESGAGNIHLGIAGDEWASLNNAMYYVELLGNDHSGSIYHEEFYAYAGACNFVYLNIFLQGAYDINQQAMRTSINAAGNLPLAQPYINEPWNYMGTETLTVFPDSIVDWILVQLRDPDDPGLLVEQRAGLLSKHGVLMETDFTTGLIFNAEPGEYYLVVKHRNHMPVMSGNPVQFPNQDSPYDFTEVALTQPYKHMDPLAVMLELKPDGSGKYGMIAGNVSPDDDLIYIGPDNDRDPILEVIRSLTGLNDINLSVYGYYNEDVTLDNEVLYIGTANDRDIILANLFLLTGSTLLNIKYESVVPPILNP